MRGLVLKAGSALVIAAITHVAILFSTPIFMTDFTLDNLRKARGGDVNTLRVSPPRTATARAVPMVNPDTVGLNAELDLSDGPVLLTMPSPQGVVYWSVSVFAHNTDTAFLQSDRDISEETVEIFFVGPGDSPPEGATRVAYVQSTKAFLIVRTIPPDRYDAGAVAAVLAQLRTATLGPAAP